MKQLLLLLLAFLLPLTSMADLEAHFLDVGHGDCTIITCDGEHLAISCEKVAEKKEELYVGNSNSRVYHYASCESVTTMKDKNKTYFDSVEQAESKGYHPCKRCSPGT